MGSTPSPSRIVKVLKLSSTASPIRQSATMKIDGRLQCHLTARQRAAPCARDLRIDVAVDDVVIDAARGAHDDGADGEQEKQPEIGIGLAEGAPGKRHRPEAGEGKQKEPDRPVSAGKPQIRQKRGRREAVDQVAGRGVGDGGGFALGWGRGMSSL